MSARGVAATTSAADRMRGAVWGQFVGDAACLGVHWIYDPAEIDRRWPDGIRGYEQPAPGHYHARRRAGELTHYGDMAMLQLESLVERGGVDPVDIGRRFVAMIGSPSYAGYRDKAMRGTLARYQAFTAAHPADPFDFQQGADDFEPATVSRLASVVVAHDGDDRLLDIVRTVTLVTQDNARALAYASYHALVLRSLLRGGALADAFALAADELPEIEAAAEVRERLALASAPARTGDVTEATRQLGQHCRLDQSLPSAIVAALAHPTDLASAVLTTAHAGGDSAGRSAMIGAWLGAALGIEGVPAAWRERLAERERIATLVERLVGIAGPR